MVAFQCLMAWLVRDMAWWKVVALAYLVGGSASQNLFCAQHELSHFLAHRRLGVNRALSLLSNCPLVVPMATAFRKYHQEHHSHLVRARAPAPLQPQSASLPLLFSEHKLSRQSLALLPGLQARESAGGKACLAASVLPGPSCAAGCCVVVSESGAAACVGPACAGRRQLTAIAAAEERGGARSCPARARRAVNCVPCQRSNSGPCVAAASLRGGLVR